MSPVPELKCVTLRHSVKTARRQLSHVSKMKKRTYEVHAYRKLSWKIFFTLLPN